jgi:hypothetical protein
MKLLWILLIPILLIVVPIFLRVYLTFLALVLG